jgi:PAS domain-containing protein
VADASTVLDVDGARCYARAVLDGLTFEQMIGRTSTDPRWRALRVDGSPFPGEEHPAMQVLRTGERVEGVIMGVSRPDGRLTWISIDAEPLRRVPGGPVYGAAAFFDDVTDRLAAGAALREALAERTRLAGDLRAALDRLRSLARVLPVCAACKNVRDDQGYWRRIEAYLAERVGKDVSHGLCPGCLERLYPEEAGDQAGDPPHP